MTNYRNGAELERATKRLFEANGYYVVRAAGSKGAADLVALKRGEVVLVQCKLDGYLLPGERVIFWGVAESVGAAAVVAQWHKEGRSARRVRVYALNYSASHAGIGLRDEWSPDWAIEET